MAGRLFGAGVMLVLSMLVLAVTVAEHDEDHASCHSACIEKFLVDSDSDLSLSLEELRTCLYGCEGDEGYVDVHSDGGTSEDTH
ncbi:hypothetical protein BaRGS_00020995 [Batillaria attramentaria]|uniref:Uncharacterized protein n=1 Tax=Batillaria attramentaria TaxID=370345 RepID=A0ABD0KL00_9CAEN